MNKILHRIKTLVQSLAGFSEQNVKSINPWAGLTSYEDPEDTDNPLVFCGRDDESLELFRLIDDNLVVTLYGKSGIGKTSLLNAGVFPLLRKNGYMPLYVRLSLEADKHKPFAVQIIETLTRHIKKIYGEESIKIYDVVDESQDSYSEEYLWSFFARRKFFNREGIPVFPVIVLDQFEENIRLDRKQSTLLLKQIAYMANQQNMIKDSFVNGEYYVYDYNFRFVLSVREDDLFRLEDIISGNYLTSLRNGRYRLQNLKEECARAIVEKVGYKWIEERDVDEISRKIIDISRSNDDRLIQTNIISLICSRLFDKTIKNEGGKISLVDVNDYLASDPFEEYYTEAVRKLTEGEKRFIETNFVSMDGRRNMLPEKNLKSSVKKYDCLIEGKTKIFQKLKSNTGEYNVELIHDGLCPVVVRNRLTRLERKNRIILSLSLLIVGLIGIWMLETSIVNDFVRFFLAINNNGPIGFADITALTQLLAIILFPIGILSIIYDVNGKKVVSGLFFVIYILPFLVFPDKVIGFLCEGIDVFNTDNGFPGIIEMLRNISERRIVFIIYTVIIFALCAGNFSGKGWKTWKKGQHKFMVESRIICVYLLIIALFLFYKSIFNNGNFTIVPSDSSWGLTIIPLLLFYILKPYSLKLGNRYAFRVYIMLLLIMTICSAIGALRSLNVLTYCIVTASVILMICYYDGNIMRSLFKTICSVGVIAILMVMNLGYNPISLGEHKISRVYPWKIIVSEDNGNYSVFDALYGDTILPPEYKMRNSRFYRLLHKNSFTESLRCDSIGEMPHSFPMKLNKNGNGEWILSLEVWAPFEYSISKLVHTSSQDSTTIIDKDGAELFLKLRRDITEFCITGDSTILLEDVKHIRRYEKALDYNLEHSRQQMRSNDSIMSEAVIVPFVRSLARSLYMNMLKEAILKGHYADFVRWFTNHYNVSVLTDITSESKIWMDSRVIYNCDLQLKTDSGKNSAHRIAQSGTLNIALPDLNDDRVYAWNNLLQLFFLYEYAAYAQYYSSSVENINKKNQEKIKGLKKALSNHSKALEANLVSSENTRNELNRLYVLLSDSVSALNKDWMADVFNKTIDAMIAVNNDKRRLSSEIDDFHSNIEELSLSLRTAALIEADEEFKRILSESLNLLISLINDNPTNVYNGFLISICQNLYSVGVYRGYDMNIYTEQMEEIERLDKLPMYEFVREIDAALKLDAQNVDLMQKAVDVVVRDEKKVIEQMR